MIPVNQVILGGDPLLTNSVIGNNLEERIQLLDKYKRDLEVAKQMQQQIQSSSTGTVPQKLIWDEIDAELNPMTEEQKNMLLQDEDYIDNYTKIQNIVNSELLNLVKARIENTQEGKDLLQQQLKIVKKLKKKIIEETNREMEMFKKFREFSKQHPEVTYDEFIKENM